MDENKKIKEKLLEEEDRRVMYLQGLVDTAILKIMNAKLTRNEALNIVLKIRSIACDLFPNSVETFDLIYMGRFKRAIDEFTVEE